MQQARPMMRAAAHEPSILEDYVLPDILEEYDLEEYPERGAVRAAHPARRASPAQVDSRMYATPPRPAVSSHGARLMVVPTLANGAAPTASRQLSPRPPLRPVLTALDYDETEDDNPFARSHMSASVWFRASAAAVGMFGAVLFGRVLLEASEVPATQTSLPPSAAAPTVTVETAAPGLGAPSVPEPQAASAAAAPQPLAATTERASERSARQARGHRAAPDDSADKSERRAEASERRAEAKARRAEAKARRVEAKAQRAEARAARQSKSSSVASASAIADERPSNTLSGMPALLRINSRPWSQIFIDGKLFGNTPQLGIQLPAGKHSVRLVNSEFGMSKTITLKLAAGESVTRVEMLTE